MADQIPDWVEKTPHLYFCLSVDDSDGNIAQDIDLTRDEYIPLKAHLAAMRGHTKIDDTDVGGMETRFTELAADLVLPDGSGVDQAARIAQHVIIAREFYRRDPELITARAAELDEFMLYMAEHGAIASED
jgi:hypothetical protein